jgi:PAS domain S-box-containing protein
MSEPVDQTGDPASALRESEARASPEPRVGDRTAELSAAIVALRDSEFRYRTLFESMDEGFCVVEMLWDGAGRPIDYRFVEMNPAFEAHTGFRDAHGRTIRELVPEHDEHWSGNRRTGGWGSCSRTSRPRSGRTRSGASSPGSCGRWRRS